MRLNQRVLLAAACLLAATAATTTQAAISFTGTPYVQNFDAFAGAAGNVPFSNDTTIQGLYAYISGGTTAGDAVAGVPDIFARNSATVAAGAGSTTYPAAVVVAQYFYRASAAATDVQLGFDNSDPNSRGVGTGYISTGFALTNNTGVAQTGFYLSYTPSASSTALTNTDSVDVSYAFDATGVADADGSYTTVPGLGYSVTAAGVLTGPSFTSISGINWAAGSTLFIRFKDTNVGGVDRFSRIDNVVIIPEPASLAVLGLAAMVSRRRRV